MKGIRLLGPKTGRAGLASFLLANVHAHDVVTVADKWGVALRGEHHCNPAVTPFSPATATRISCFNRASVGVASLHQRCNTHSRRRPTGQFKSRRRIVAAGL
ncbi:MAG: aminotransferase class V-fold PLP-dependent enzyme [Limisphaerales bacterium]